MFCLLTLVFLLFFSISVWSAKVGRRNTRFKKKKKGLQKRRLPHTVHHVTASLNIFPEIAFTFTCYQNSVKLLCFNSGHWHSTAKFSKSFKVATLFFVFTEMIPMENVLMLVFVSLTQNKNCISVLLLVCNVKNLIIMTCMNVCF